MSAGHPLPIQSMKPYASWAQTWKARLGLEVFVEAGTGEGTTTAAMAPLFEESHTVELSPAAWSRAKRALASAPGVRCYLGDSAEILPEMLATAGPRRSLVLLDTYGTRAARRGAIAPPACRLLAELQGMRALAGPPPVLMIEGLHRFIEVSSTHPHDKIHLGFPPLGEVAKVLRTLSEDLRLLCVGNTGLVVRETDPITPSAGLEALTRSRLFDARTQDLEEMVAAERTLTALPPSERAALKELALNHVAMSPSGMVRFGAHYLLWEGLALHGENHTADGVRYLEAARACGIEDGRVERHLALIEADKAAAEAAAEA